MSYNPLTNIVEELQEKMEKLFPDIKPQIAIVDDLSDIKFIDPELRKQRLGYIKDYVNANFNLIEINQYSLPLSGVLLGFFKISEKTMLILFSPSGKIGNLLAYRGIIQSYTKKIDVALELISKIAEIESISYDIIRLKKVKAIEVTAATTDSSATVAPIPIPAQASSPQSMYPKIDTKYAKKRFTFREGICLQYADGKNSIDDIFEKCKEAVPDFTKEEVLEIIDKYQKKGWIEIIYKE